MMLGALQPGPFEGDLATENNGDVVVTWQDSCPSVRIVRIKSGGLNSTDAVSIDTL